MILRKEREPDRTAEENFVAGLRARYTQETPSQEFSDRQPVFIYPIDRFFPRIVIGRRGPGQR